MFFRMFQRNVILSEGLSNGYTYSDQINSLYRFYCLYEH